MDLIKQLSILIIQLSLLYYDYDYNNDYNYIYVYKYICLFVMVAFLKQRLWNAYVVIWLYCLRIIILIKLFLKIKDKLKNILIQSKSMIYVDIN